MGLDLIKDIEKKYGAGVMVDASFVLEKEKIVVSVTPSMDISLGGGLPFGTWVNISGKEKSGKSTMALQIIANAQQQYNCPAFVADVEHRLEAKQLEGVHGLKLTGDNALQIIRSTKGNILSAEDIVNIMCRIAKENEQSVLMIDSTSALCSAKEQTDEISGQTRAIGPKILAAFCRQMKDIVPLQNHMLILIQHLIANTSGYGAAFREDSGSKIQYQNDNRLRAVKTEAWSDGDNVIGQKTTWKIFWSSFGKPCEGVTYLRYGHGLDMERDIAELAIELGIITKKGAWFSHEDFKAQGIEKVCTYLKENPKVTKSIHDTIKKML